MKQQQQLRTSHSGGFSLPEVMVSASLLALVVATSAQVYMGSGRTLQKGSLRDAVYARIADDLEELRRGSRIWACEDGIGGNPWVPATGGGTTMGATPLSTACTGRSADADKPVAYKTGRRCSTSPCPAGELLQISSFTNACDNRNTAEVMAQDNTELFPLNASTNLNWTKNLPTGSPIPPQANWATIQRTITLNADKNQLDVTYTTSADSPSQVTVNASLVPQALSWCP